MTDLLEAPLAALRPAAQPCERMTAARVESILAKAMKLAETAADPLMASCTIQRTAIRRQSWKTRT